MADRPTGYGMTAELNAKKSAKYDQDLAQEAMEWMETLLNEPSPGPSSDEVHEGLKSGEHLCRLANVIRPGAVKKINTSKMAFKQMENISFFLAFCESVGIIKTDLFQTVDLYEAQNMPQVINGIGALGRKVPKINPDLPPLGPKESDKCKREFTQEQLEAGKGIIGLQMGTNTGASQSGMTAPGTGRQIN